MKFCFVSNILVRYMNLDIIAKRTGHVGWMGMKLFQLCGITCGFRFPSLLHSRLSRQKSRKVSRRQQYSYKRFTAFTLPYDTTCLNISITCTWDGAVPHESEYVFLEVGKFKVLEPEGIYRIAPAVTDCHCELPDRWSYGKRWDSRWSSLRCQRSFWGCYSLPCRTNARWASLP